MELNYTFSKEDYYKFVMFTCKRNTSTLSNTNALIKNMVLWFFIAIIALTLAKSFDFQFSSFHWPTAFIVATPFLLFSLLFIVALKDSQKNNLPLEDGFILGEKHVELNKNGIIETTRLGVASYNWEAIVEVIENDGDTYLYMDKILAQAFPSSCFDSANEKDNFLKYIEENMATKSIK